LLVGLLAAALPLLPTDRITATSQAEESLRDDPVLGTWHLNVAKSSYVPGPAPKSQSRTYEAHPDGLQATIKTTYPDGNSTLIQFVAKYDMVEYPVTGNPDADRITLKKFDRYTADAVLTHGGKEFGSARRTISADGKQMTITFQGRDAQGRAVKNVGVYDKE
jgi:hypothetical protein